MESPAQTQAWAGWPYKLAKSPYRGQRGFASKSMKLAIGRVKAIDGEGKWAWLGGTMEDGELESAALFEVYVCVLYGRVGKRVGLWRRPRRSH